MITRSSFLMLLVLTVVCLALPATSPAQDGSSNDAVYTCSMHPQVRLPNPGDCPICSMPLIQAAKPQARRQGDVTRLELSPHARAMASVETAPVEKRLLTYLVSTVGKISYDEMSLATITSRVDGYAERLFVNFTGVEVKKDDHLVEIYSPELVVAQEELLVAHDPSLLESTKTKLQRLGLTKEQVDDLARNKKRMERITLLSPITGTVITRNVTENGAFKAGDALYQIANLDTVWAYLDLYENQLAWLRYGQHVTMTSEAFPGQTFEGQVTFVSPTVDDTTRTVKVPVHIPNPKHRLKPGMFVSASIHATLDSDGLPAPTGVEGSYTCPMHPQVLKDDQGTCPICGMTLKQIPKLEEEGPPGAILAIPIASVLDSGKSQRVYVEIEQGLFEGREVTLGPRAGGYYAILNGLEEGERVAIRGNFLLDSQAQISGAASLFYPQGAAPSSGHDHGGGDPSSKASEISNEHDHHAAGHKH